VNDLFVISSRDETARRVSVIEAEERVECNNSPLTSECQFNNTVCPARKTVKRLQVHNEGHDLSTKQTTQRKRQVDLLGL